MPEYLVKHQKPDDFEFTSARKDYKRYITKDIKDMVAHLEKLEEDEKHLLNEFVQFVFLNFKTNRSVWDTFINVFHELDVLCSLSVWSEADITCRPQILD